MSGGLNQFLTLNVPVTNGDGSALDVSGVVAKKSIYLSGSFEGTYVILASHDDVRYVPIASFVGQEDEFGRSGPQTVRRDVEFTAKSLIVRRSADRQVAISVAAQAVCSC